MMAYPSQVVMVIFLLLSVNAQIAVRVDSVGWQRDFGDHASSWQQWTVFFATLTSVVVVDKQTLVSFDDLAKFVVDLAIFG